MSYRTYTYRLPRRYASLAEEKHRLAGAFYSKVVVTFWRIYRKKGVWLSEYAMKRLNKSTPGLAAQSCNAIIEQFYATLKATRTKRKQGDTAARYPTRLRRIYSVAYKSQMIRLADGTLILPHGGRGESKQEPIVLPAWEHGEPVSVTLGWRDGEAVLYCVNKVDDPDLLTGGDIAGVDLGEVHIAVAHTKDEAFILSGKALRAKRQKLSAKRRGSRRLKKLRKSKAKQERRLQNQINDILHQQTRKLVSTLHSRGVSTVAVGDLTGIRDAIDYGSKVNQKLH
jgi:putative transposase